MTDQANDTDWTKRTVITERSGTDLAIRPRNLDYLGADGQPLAMDLYVPCTTPDTALVPAVVIVAGYPDVGFEKFAGCKFKDLGSTASWARLFATSGIAAITYSNRDPEPDLMQLLGFVRTNAETLGLDPGKIGIFASSGHGPLALSTLHRGKDANPVCLALLYGFTMDLDGHTGVSEASTTYHFANPLGGLVVSNLRNDVPLHLVRAGMDEFPGLNDALDRFVASALLENLPISLVNLPNAPHAFDLVCDDEASRNAIRQTLVFFADHLALGDRRSL